MIKDKLFAVMAAGVVSLAAAAGGYGLGRIHEARDANESHIEYATAVEGEAAAQRAETDRIKTESEKTNADTRTAYNVSFDRLADRLRAAESAAQRVRRDAANRGSCGGVPEVPGNTGGVQEAAADDGPAAAGRTAGGDEDDEQADAQPVSLEARCAITTHQCLHAMDWVQRQIEIHNGLRR